MENIVIRAIGVVKMVLELSHGSMCSKRMSKPIMWVKAGRLAAPYPTSAGKENETFPYKGCGYLPCHNAF